ncbi:hypothetical protein [Actinophytocola glycyrrhizae]|uniref:GAF domain-containing protein n=1 Tax=Actinophytocola glycyrrhizae TaxID=2044873 RepID=A0ABV9RZ39_9PSEU
MPFQTRFREIPDIQVTDLHRKGAVQESAGKVVRLIFVLLSVILLGMWVNIYTDHLRSGDPLATIANLGWSNLLLGGGAGCLGASEYVALRRRVMERRDLEHRLEVLRHREHRLLENTLGLVCDLISKTLRVPCNGRYFIAVPDEHGEIFLEQDRELAVLNIRMPREFGFTRVATSTPHIVTGRAFTERRALYERLPIDHHDLYDATIARMIEPTQRWVLACPVLALDPETNRHDDEHLPHGVICFYSTQEPAKAGQQRRVDECLRYAELFADQMSQLLNMLELTQAMAAPHDENTGMAS